MKRHTLKARLFLFLACIVAIAAVTVATFYATAKDVDGLAEKYQQIQDSAKVDLSELIVDSGTTASQLLSTEDISGIEKKLQFSYESWLTTIYKNESQYTVVVNFSKDARTNTMVLEDGAWKTQSVDSHQKEFAPEDYAYKKGTFNTLLEALRFVLDMDVEAENPFA